MTSRNLRTSRNPRTSAIADIVSTEGVYFTGRAISSFVAIYCGLNWLMYHRVTEDASRDASMNKKTRKDDEPDD